MGQLSWTEKASKNLYKKMLSILEEVEDHRESRILSQSSEFKKLVKKGLEDIKAGRIKPWKEVWDEL